MMHQERIVIESVTPQLDRGQYFIKRVVGQQVVVAATVLSDGHDVIQAELCVKHQTERKWRLLRMQPLENDRFQAVFQVDKPGFYEYQVRGWVDYALNWQHGILAKIGDGQHVRSELLDGVGYLQFLLAETAGEDLQFVQHLIAIFPDESKYTAAINAAGSERLQRLFLEHPQRILANTSPALEVYVDRVKANFSTWYEFFPRSASPVPGVHGTFKDCERLLPHIAEMGFDTLYFPPIHPIGEKNRKGKNNTVQAVEGDCGVPWAIGSVHGGHRSIHPELGSQEDFKSLIDKAAALGIEIAMDLAFQAAPDHPYISEHPKWFRKRPDGTMQYAENPPKKYQDIVNFHFESTAYKSLWNELLEVTLQWVRLGIRVFRVDNPHTKPYYFWNWLIAEVKKRHPEVLFLAEAFSRPKVMQQLAKQGFSQSYTYFTWRVNKQELIDYMIELTQTEMQEYYRPNFWPNTPDINPFHLQHAGEAMHKIRYALAAALCGNVGIYGPVFEYMISDPLPGKEEYMDSEKYEIRHWDWSHRNNLTHFIGQINAIRQQQEALQQTNNIYFCGLENPNLLAFYKWNDTRTSEVLVVINLDANGAQQGTVRLPYEALGRRGPVAVHDLITGHTYDWNEEWNFVALDQFTPIHIFKLNE